MRPRESLWSSWPCCTTWPRISARTSHASSDATVYPFAATAALGASGARTPFPDEFQELMNNVTVTMDKCEGQNIIKLTSKINGKYIYMPYGYAAAYWTNALSENISSAIGWTFYSTSLIERSNYLRSVGHVGESKGNMVRPVKNK